MISFGVPQLQQMHHSGGGVDNGGGCARVGTEYVREISVLCS